MKIGILTYHRSHNYGAVLQAFALKSYIKGLGHQVEFVDYWPKYRKGMYDLIDFSLLKEKIGIRRKVKLLYEILLIPQKLIRYNRFQKFIKHSLQISGKPEITIGCEIKDEYDIIVFGSDQIWRNNKYIRFKGFDPVYWGNFPENTSAKKIAYAASMGELDHKGCEDFIIRHLSNFDFISVRENNLKELIAKFTSKEVKQVLDPVFLLNRNSWEAILPKKRESKEKYLLFYHLIPSSGAKKLVKKIADAKKLKIIEISGTVKFFVNPAKTRQYIGPIEYLQLFQEASFVVSTSFHGVAFSIIFKKQFYALGMKNNAERAMSLLNNLNIKERYLNDSILLTDIVSPTEINYDIVDKNIERMKGESCGYLNRTINGIQM